MPGGKRASMRVSSSFARPITRVAALFLLLISCPAIWSQASTPKAETAAVQPEVPKDTLGRNSPRGTVLSFLSAARKNNDQVAALYLNTRLRDEDAQTLARQLAVVLDRRLPARLNELSDKPEGSIPNPLRPDEDLVGTIVTAHGSLDILLERVDRGKIGKIWLFSSKTLNSIPGVFDELSPPLVERFLPEFLISTRVATIPLFQWLALLVGLPLLYFLTGLLNKLGGMLLLLSRSHVPRSPNFGNFQILPPPIRLLLLAFAIRWLLARAGITLLARQFWSTTALSIAIAGSVWLLILLNSWGEHYLLKRCRRRNLSGSASVLRVLRRVIDVLVLFAGLLFTFYHFGVDPTAALAGLGVGGIAVALAAQKTLENVVGGISLIADQAVRVGDTLKLGDILGTVEDVGLRSIRIRTLDRTIVSVPNGQIATMSIEILSARDKFWFHPLVSLRLDTTPAQICSIVAGVRQLLAEHSSVEPNSERVRFIRWGAYSLDVDIFAYTFADDWNQFLAIQEQLLLRVMDTIQRAGACIALPSQTMYLATGSTETSTAAVAQAPHAVSKVRAAESA